MKETLIIIVFIIVFYIVFIMNNSSLIKFNVDGDYVFVRDAPNKEQSANLLNELTCIPLNTFFLFILIVHCLKL